MLTRPPYGPPPTILLLIMGLTAESSSGTAVNLMINRVGEATGRWHGWGSQREPGPGRARTMDG
ncbi:hypothetical protein D7147_00945 [Micromonospora musae]|uniref:Uncharacterized protein n=1 Tax=Micromonospora musae TaxID=1894970 RepID=A0ABX9RIR8_9ACTN|nr:hypothetical protein D7147_00945 [Micromonospora musae]